MAHSIFKRLWNWLSEGWSNMADLADKIDDLICSFEGNNDTTMDTVAMLIFGWLLFVLFVLVVGKYLYAKYILKSEFLNEKSISTVETVKPSANSVDSAANAVVKESVKIKPSGGLTTPTPPIRKRLSTKKGALPQPMKLSLYSPPTATGPDSDSVNWVNEVFGWLYSDLVVVNELLNVWIQSLNDCTQKSVSEHGVGVEFVRVLPESHAPQLTNVFSECASNDDVTITCDCEANPAFQLKSFRQKGDKVEVSHYRVNVNKFRARLNVYCVTEKLLADVKCDGWPDIKVALAPVGSIKSNLDEQQLQDLIAEIVVIALRNTFVTLNLYQFPSCPRFSRNPVHIEPVLPVHYDSLDTTSSTIPAGKPAKRLLVKVVKASNLGAKKGCTEPYCVVEMDDPPQKNQTSVKKDTNSPVWDEHFLFDLGLNTAELLFEIYDRANKINKFLGLGIVGVEELIINPSQRQTISLQSRPYECDEVSGSLTVEFLFIEGADIPQMGDKPFKLKETLRTLSPSGGVITTTKTVFSNQEAPVNITNGDVITDSALKELELRNRASIPPANKSTLIIHSVQRQPSIRHCVKVEQTNSGCWQEVPKKEKQGIRESAKPIENINAASNANTSDERGRSRRKKRDFFGTIKKRLSRSRIRSKSVDPGEYEEPTVEDPSVGRSISADRARDPSAHSIVPGLRGMDDSERSSLSEASGISGASTRTYINEASTLVLETTENGIKKHYLVPLSMAQRSSKWKKKGVKLHIFNDHTFIAKHLPGGTSCHVCRKTLARRLGKQGYECRDCDLRCHKHCHVRVDNNCTNSTIQNLELSYAQSPYVDRRILQLKKSHC